MKILVTGGAGFIGSNLVKRISNNNEIWVIDNLSMGSLKNLKIDPDHFLLDYTKIPAVDCIFHLGMPSSTPMYKANPNLVHMTIADAMKILECAKLNKVPVVYASTSSLYNGNPIPWKESMPILVTDYYTETRYAIERLFELYRELYNVKSVGLRLFSVYGPGEKSKGQYANLVTQFLLDMKENKHPVLYYKGEQTRDFVYVDDVVECFISAMIKLQSWEPIPKVINVGTGRATSLNDLVALLNVELGKSIQPTYYVPESLKNYVKCTLADTARMRTNLIKNNFTTLEEGVEKLIQFYHNGA